MAVAEAPIAVPAERPEAVGPIGRLGGWAADHARMVAIAWAIVTVALAVFAPKVETALSGAGWQANGSESVQARALIEQHFRGLSSSAPVVVVHSPTLTVGSPAFQGTVARAERILRSDPRISTVVPPRPGVSISRDRHTVLVVAGARRDPTAMVAAADSLKGKMRQLGTSDISVSLDRRVRNVVGLQRGQPDRDDEVRALLLAGHARDPCRRLRIARSPRGCRCS